MNRTQAAEKRWERMQNGKDAAEHALIEYHDHDEHCGTKTPYEQGTLVDLLLGLRHLCDLKEDMDFDRAVIISGVEYRREKAEFSHPGNPACADLKEAEGA